MRKAIYISHVITGGTVKLLEYLAKKVVPKDGNETALPSAPLPKGIGKNMELSGLNLMNLNVSDLKNATSTLPSSLNLAQNWLEKLPDNFDDLCINLTSLALNKNRFREFPRLSDCVNLVVLYLWFF